MIDTVLAFDIYGTLLDTGSITMALKKILGLDDQEATELSKLWRRYQLEHVIRTFVLCNAS